VEVVARLVERARGGREVLDALPQGLTVAGKVLRTDLHEVGQCALAVRAVGTERAGELVDARVELVDLHGGGGALAVDHRTAAHRVAAGVGGSELHVTVGDHRGGDLHGAGVGGDVDAAVHPQTDLHEVALRFHGGHLPDLDAQHPDIGTLVDADGLVEVGGDLGG